MPKTRTNRASLTAARNKVWVEGEIDSEIFSLVECVAKEEGVSTQEWIDRAVAKAYAALKK